MGIITAFHEGGLFMYFILAFGLVTIGLIVERARALFFQIQEPSADFRQKILGYINQGDLKGAQTYAETVGAKTSLGRVVAMGCQLRNGAGADIELQARMDERLTSEISQIDKRTGFLAMLGNVATLLGLLGTIAGMIGSFAAVASANPADRATMLSRGISEAMNCTAFGLIVAIPALVAYAIFQNKTDKLVASLTEGVTEIYHDLLFFTEASTQAPVKASSASQHQAPSAHRHAPTVSV